MRPFIDDRGRLFGRVSVVDVIVLLLIVAVAAFAWARFSGDQTMSKDYRMEIFIAATRIPQVDQSNVGDTVRDEGGAVLGRIEKVLEEPSKVDVVNAEGKVQQGATSWFLKDITITIKGQAQVSDGVIAVGGNPLHKADSLVLVGRDYKPKTVIIYLEVAK